jgi:DNA-binding SARP family transcriptional activator
MTSTSGSRLFIRVLGPIEALSGGRMAPVRGRHARSLLVALVLGAGRAVSVDHLIAAVWGDSPPPSAHSTLQTVVSALRRHIGHTAIEYEEGSYVLRVPLAEIDLVRFETLSLEARDRLEEEPARAREIAMEALDLWMGRPFADVADDEFVYLATSRLEELRVSTMEVRLEADVALGRYAQAVALLEGAVEEHPHRERLWYLLMTALAREGRRVEALHRYRRLQDRLAELGLEPSRDLRDLEQAILEETPGVRARIAHPYGDRAS